MRKILFILLGFLLFVSPKFVLAERISDFIVNYNINSDGTVLVKEQIMYDFEDLDRHGIFRIIDKKHAAPATVWYKNRSIEIDLISIKRDGKEEEFLITEDKSKVEYKIGSPITTISGSHVYEIEYLLRGALSYGSSGAEFYFNATGNEWPVTIDRVSVIVSSNLKENHSCYRGYVGDTNSCQKYVADDQVVFTDSNLLPGEGLTIATEIDQSKVATLVIENISFLPLGYFVAILWLLYFARSVYVIRTKDKFNKPVVAQYEPIKEYLPMYTGVIYDGRLDPKDITAGIVYMAEQGFIKIKHTEKKALLFFNVTDYEITLLRPLSELPNQFLKTLSSLLFSENSVVGTNVLLSELTEKRVENSKIILSLQNALRLDLKNNGLQTTTLPPWNLRKTLILVFLISFFGSFLFVDGGVELVIFVIFISVFIGVVALVDRFTVKGHELRNHLEGFKLFLSVTDKDRFDFHNAPDKSPELFMKYLPYAIALGVEEKWAEVFGDITMPQPDWYEGGNIGAFSATTLTNDISKFSSAFSASSGTQGSSGGGSSGGGGGGGGGGSW